MDVGSFQRWYDYSRARDVMFKATDNPDAPWHIVRSNDKRRARLNAISHILKSIPYKKVEHEKVNVAMLPAGASRVELLEPLDADSTIAKFLEKRGPGIHHVAVRVPSIRAALSRLKAEGARLIDEEPRVGAEGCLVALVHPAASGGVR